jgi:peptidoglycan/LPS O-acetylase OafA/YrhL
MADASYTIYVVHLPIVIVVAALLRSAPMGGTPKMFVTTAVAFVASWWVYRVWRWVRPVGGRAAPR